MRKIDGPAGRDVSRFAKFYFMASYGNDVRPSSHPAVDRSLAVCAIYRMFARVCLCLVPLDLAVTDSRKPTEIIREFRDSPLALRM